MLDSIISGLKDQIGGELVSKAGISGDRVDDVLKVVGQTAKDKVGSEIASGGLASAMSLFSKGANSSGANGLLAGISSSITENLTSKLGLSPDMAAKVSSMAVPVLTSLVASFNSKTPDDDASPLMEMFGGGSEGFAGAAKKALGGLFG
jgi:hypothetical protein